MVTGYLKGGKWLLVSGKAAISATCCCGGGGNNCLVDLPCNPTVGTINFTCTIGGVTVVLPYVVSAPIKTLVSASAPPCVNSLYVAFSTLPNFTYSGNYIEVIDLSVDIWFQYASGVLQTGITNFTALLQSGASTGGFTQYTNPPPFLLPESGPPIWKNYANACGGGGLSESIPVSSTGTMIWNGLFPLLPPTSGTIDMAIS